mmetsp:Transcript_66054/g.157956  ORF Transcript_66054/g.157956 Transcript_66054/m.157956 type:complete len:240 (-) Transcript_66054:99-818(-)|eukprot:CAMPEP_0178421962 /NCGR_PEP_ID=MMETSP0689_2-20121128/26923_1 /TAXON_ID=160604 /ORGANISM="Amphidinium massartii, Strain CS-259" /LENGTH=239 /DNA_ID=CAMNT_0020043501 /DNA_START=118 /DNA_END=837 /DNA_ORIENTATION=-
MAAASQNADSLYVKDCREAQHSTHGIQTLTGQISRVVSGGLTSDADFKRCRQLIEQAGSEAAKIRTILLRIHDHHQTAQNTSERTNRRLMYQKLSDNLAITIRVLEDVMSRFNTEVEKKHLHLGSRGGQAAAASSSAGGVAPHPLLGQAEEASTSIRRVDEEIKALQQIYTDLAAAAEEQQVSVDTIQEHMERACGDLEQGSQHLDMGKYDLQRQSRRKIWAAGATAVFLMSTAVVFFS